MGDYDFLSVSFWSDCKNRHMVRTCVNSVAYRISKIDDIDLQIKIKEELANICLYIRDYYQGLNQQKLAIWMLLEFEIVFSCFAVTLIELLPKFGCWKDLNLILLEIKTDQKQKQNQKQKQIDNYTDLETAIYKYIGKVFNNDIKLVASGEFHNISNLVKFIGKEKRVFDKKTGFVKKFVKQQYKLVYKYSPARALQLYRQDCNLLFYHKKDDSLLKIKNSYSEAHSVFITNFGQNFMYDKVSKNDRSNSFNHLSIIIFLFLSLKLN